MSEINDLMVYFKDLGKHEQIKSKSSRKEIIWIRAKISEITTNKTKPEEKQS